MMGGKSTATAARRRVASARDDVRARAVVAQRHAQRVASGVAETAEDTIDRLRDTVHDQKQSWEEPTRRAQLGFFTAAQAVLSVLVALPRFVVRALAIAREVTERAEHVVERGDRYSQQARDLAARIEPSRRVRRQQRAKTAGVIAASATVGFGLGMLAERLRRQRELEREGALSMQRHAHDVAQLDARRTGTDVARLTVAVSTEDVGEADVSTE